MNDQLSRISSLLLMATKKHLLKKAVFSKPSDRSITKLVLTEKSISSRPVLQAEFFHTDNKVTHQNLPVQELSSEDISKLGEGFMQLNLICMGAEAEYRLSSSGRAVLINDKRLERVINSTQAQDICIQENNRKKNHILTGSEPFLIELGVSDKNGRIFDKKQSKFKQINRFLEIIRDCEEQLPDDEIRICDLCCGKSYLSFAAYHYFSVIKGMKVSMTGIDLKSDVIKDCSEIAKKLGFDGLEFICEDIRNYNTDKLPSLVISLHACDIATDIVLVKAAEWKADVILATPCCHHEMNHNINCPQLDFITKHSMLRQKLCDAATDALRLLRLEAEGYGTSTLELIDPNETPKNIMLKAIRSKSFNKNSKDAQVALEKYNDAKKFFFADTDTSSLHF